MVMRGVMEEKTNRISEVVISSVKPFQLMIGKIIGIGAVGITQFIIWIILIGLLQFTIPLLFPTLAGQITQTGTEGVPMAGNSNMIAKIAKGFNQFPWACCYFVSCCIFLGDIYYMHLSSLLSAV
jgi:ABC-2 type transport system permease protein